MTPVNIETPKAKEYKGTWYIHGSHTAEELQEALNDIKAEIMNLRSGDFIEIVRA